MAFVREIGRNGVLLLRHMAVTQVIELNQIQLIYIGKSIALLVKLKKRDISDIPTNNCALRACYGVSNRIKIYIN